MIKDVKVTLEKIIDEIAGFTDVAVIGLSGGADSTLVATLCRIALGKDNVYGVHMPCGQTDKEKFNANSVRIANKLGIHQLTVDIEGPYYKMADVIDIPLDVVQGTTYVMSDVNLGNIKSRLRMTTLYSIGHHLGDALELRARVMGTGNLSEDFIGYDTKGGDALADIFPIGELFKSEVYQLLDYFADDRWIEESMIDRTPSAGLEEDQTDEEDLGYTYNAMEPAIVYCLEHYDKMPDIIKSSASEVTKFVWGRHIANKHKHMAPKVVELGQARTDSHSEKSDM